jgi:16S rRNA (uracil1498-N3)-methyltransferase
MKYRYFIYPQRVQQKTILFTDEQMHHMRKVLRRKAGDIIECFDGTGMHYKVEIKKLSRDGSYGKVVEDNKVDLAKLTRITILQAYPALLAKLDLVVEKCTELGADDFVFFKADRSEVYVLPSAEKAERWKKIVIKAAEQSRRISMPEVYCLQNFEELDLSRYDLKILLYENAENIKWPESICKGEVTSPLGSPKNILIAVGPEGGWSEREVEMFKKLGFELIRPFENILRAETAPIAAVAVIRASLMTNN